MEALIGRKSVQQELQSLYTSNRAEFVVVYGRRRVGKTFLIREYFKDKFCFYHTGLSPADIEDGRMQEKQLQVFCSSLRYYGWQSDCVPSNWIEAFAALRALIEQSPTNEKCIVFIDELPWMDTPRSGFVSALEHFWNSWGSGRSNLLLIVCGSATSWISDKIINNHGGLYGRITYSIYLRPFTLSECKEYFEHNNHHVSHYDLAQYYMIFGGIPYYLSLLKNSEGLAQNVDRLVFQKSGQLYNEFERLYASLFCNHEAHVKVVRFLASRRTGYTRKEIADATKIPYGGGLTTLLKSLEASDFIESYIPYGESSRQTHYKLVDCFSLFFCNFRDGKAKADPHFWEQNISNPQINAWRGFAFENVCYLHQDEIKNCLGIRAVSCEIAPWRCIGNEECDGAQVDMLISRKDGVMNLCEIKFTADEYLITKDYDKALRRKIARLSESTRHRKTIVLTMITSYGVIKNEYAGIVQQVVTIDDLVGR